MIQRILIATTLICFFSSCSKVSEPVIWNFEDDRVQIIVNGSQESWADPWQPTISIYVDDSLVSAQPGLPVFSSELNKKTIKVKWNKEERGKIIFMQRDDTQKEFILPRLGGLLN